MKKILSLLLALVLFCAAFASCSGAKGEYSCIHGDEASGSYALETYTFSGDEVTKTIKVILDKTTLSTESFRGTYSLIDKDGAQQIVFSLYDLKGAKSELHSFSASYIMASDGSYVSIGGTIYNRK